MLTMTGTDQRTNAVLARNDAMGVKGFELRRGLPLAARFKAGTPFRFDEDFPEGRRLTDLISVTWAGFPVSRRLRDLLEIEPRIEFLPIKVADHEGKIVAEEYWLANFLEPVDAVDLARSEGEENPMDPGRYLMFEKLVLVEKKIPAGRHAFRLAQRPETVIVDADLAGAIAKAKLTGIRCVPVAEYSGSGSPVGT